MWYTTIFKLSRAGPSYSQKHIKANKSKIRLIIFVCWVYKNSRNNHIAKMHNLSWRNTKRCGDTSFLSIQPRRPRMVVRRKFIKEKPGKCWKIMTSIFWKKTNASLLSDWSTNKWKEKMIYNFSLTKVFRITSCRFLWQDMAK